MEITIGVELFTFSKSFKDFQAVQDLSFSVQHGDIYGFLGQNGAGKSTLLKLIALLERPSKGEILVGGKPLSQLTLRVVQPSGVCCWLTAAMLLFANGLKTKSLKTYCNSCCSQKMFG